jgi:tetratricopeptide (TPR) repeat protein
VAWAICLALVALVAVAYCQVVRNEFVQCDDDEYIYRNPAVRQGLTWAGVDWAFREPHAANWHPLTWMSHMLDWQWFGGWAPGHHLESLALHAASAVVLFLALRLMTGALWSSAAVAALFALHPLRVESVAWAAERKDVLSGLFFMLTLLSYGWYARRPGVLRYALVCLALALGLMSKAMLVTLPCVLLLLDYWPLGRWKAARADSGKTVPRSPKVASRGREAREVPPAPPAGIWFWLALPGSLTYRFFAHVFLVNFRLVAEKVPLFAMAAFTSWMEVRGQVDVHVMSSLDAMPLGVRIANALLACATYLGKTFWPVNLAVFYPHLGILNNGLTPELLGWAIGSGLLLAVVTAAVVLFARRRPYAVTGWLWFLGTLVPVIGLVQVGTQSMADRYAYLPTIGIYLLVVWAAKDAAERWPRGRMVLALAAPALLAACTVVTWLQVAHWRNTYTLFEHAVSVTPDNYFAYNELGRAYYADAALEQGAGDHSAAHGDRERAAGHYAAVRWDLEQAKAEYEAAIKILPYYDYGNNNLGGVYMKLGEFEKADECFQRALEVNQQYADVCHNLGMLRKQQGRFKEAVGLLTSSVELRRDKADHWCDLGEAYLALGDLKQAAEALQVALQIDPDLALAYFDLGVVCIRQKRPGEAIACFEQVLRAEPDNAGAHNNLAILYAQKGDAAAAERHRQEVLRIQRQAKG